jgi:hypothetical protein
MSDYVIGTSLPDGKACFITVLTGYRDEHKTAQEWFNYNARARFERRARGGEQNANFTRDIHLCKVSISRQNDNGKRNCAHSCGLFWLYYTFWYGTYLVFVAKTSSFFFERDLFLNFVH